MKHLLCPTTYEQVLREDPWECFLCAKSQSFTDSFVKPRTNWKAKIISMFRTNFKSNVQQLVKRNHEKKKIRVLSLFDGLSTGAGWNSCLFSFSLLHVVQSFTDFFFLFGKTDVFRLTGAPQVRYSRGQVLRERNRPGRVNGECDTLWRSSYSFGQRERHHEGKDQGNSTYRFIDRWITLQWPEFG